MKKAILSFAAFTVSFLLLAGIAQASSMTWNWSLSDASNNPLGSGTMVTNGDGNGAGSLVMGITGTFDGQNIQGVTPLGSDPGFTYDNLFHASGMPFDYQGLLMNVANIGNVNLYSIAEMLYAYDYKGIPLGANCQNGLPVHFTASVSPVPLPASGLLFAPALLGMIGFSKFRRKTSANTDDSFQLPAA